MLFNPTRNLMNSLALFLGFVGILAVSDLNAQVQIDGPKDTASWAFHKSGRIFAASKSTGFVIEYDTKGKEVRKFDVGIYPTEMIIKGNRLVVACSGPGRCSVIDLEANKVAGEIKIESVGPRALFCSKVDNGIVHAVCLTGHSGFFLRVVQVDIKNLKVLNLDSSKSWTGGFSHVAMSADGKWIATTGKRVSEGPTVVTLRQFNEATGVQRTAGVLESNGQILAGPANRYWMLGDKLYPLGAKYPISEFSGNPVAIHPQLDLAVSLSSNELKLFKFSNTKLLKQLPLSFPEAKNAKSSSEKLESLKKDSTEDVLIGFGFDSTVASQYVFIASDASCQVFDLKKAGIPLEPMLLMNTPGHVVAKVGKEISVPLTVTNPNLSEKAIYEIKEGPEQARISGDQLVWTPTETNIGRHTFLITAKAAGISDETSIELDVQSRHTKLDFHVVGMAVDAKGQYAVAWSNIRGPINAKLAPPNKIVVIDLETGNVLVQKSLATAVKSAVIQGSHVYLIPSVGNVLQKLDLGSLQRINRIFLQSPGKAVYPYPGGHVAYTNAGYFYVIDSETLKEIRKPVRTPFREKQTPVLVSSEAVALASKILDQDDGALMMLKKSSGLPILGPRKQTLQTTTFGRKVEGNQIMSSTGAIIAKIPDRHLYVSPFDPVAFGIGQEFKRVDSGHQTQFTLDTLSLVDGTVLDSRIFELTTMPDRLKINSYVFFARKDKVVCVADNQIYVISLDHKMMEAAPQPLHFPVTKLPFLSIDAPQTIDLKAIGGKGELAYRLVSEFTGLAVDSTNGEVTIDTPLLWKNYLEKKASSTSSPSSNQASNEQQIKDLLGQPLPADKLALTVPIQLAVTDEEAQENQISVFAIVIGDKTAVDKIAAEKKATVERLEAQKVARQKEAKEAHLKKQEAKIAAQKQSRESIIEKGVENRRKRLNEIEGRLKRIESSTESVLFKLKALENTDRP